MSFDIGNNEVDVRTNLALIDTLTVKSYTVMLDSIPTSAISDPIITVGNLHDDEFGTINASSYFRVIVPTEVSGSNPSYSIHNDAVFDSLKFYMVYNRYYEGDTLLPFKLSLHRLSAELKPNTDGFFYNNDSIPAFPEPIGSTVFMPSPNSGDTVWITVDPELGREIFAKMKENEQQVLENDRFLEYFKGLMLRGDESNNVILGFNFPEQASEANIPGLRFYYHYFEFTTIRKRVNFRSQATVNFGNGLTRIQFNRFTLTDPKISFPLTQKNKMPVTATGGRSYVLSGLGVVTRLEIPYLKNLNLINDDIRVLDARLELEPVSGTYTKESLPSDISLNETNNSNNWGLPVQNRSGNLEIADLKIDMLYQENTSYTFNITSFVVSKLQKESDVIPAMLLHVTGDDFYRTGKHLILGSQNHDESKVRLKIYYITVNK